MEVEALRQQLAARVNAALDLPKTLQNGVPQFDKYRLQCDPEILRGSADLLARQLPSDVEVIAGVEVGGIGIAAALSLRTGLPWALARRGRGEVHISSVAGNSIVGRRTVLVKDAAMGRSSLPPLALSLREQERT